MRGMVSGEGGGVEAGALVLAEDVVLVSTNPEDIQTMIKL